ncbi:MAG TPA: hypothetical protein VGH33_04580 [Isosphaeraceae bacterium]
MSYQFPDAGSPFPYEPERKQRGCLFYGCLFAAILLGLILLLVGLAGWATYRAADQFVQQYAEDAPVPIPVVEKPAAEVDAIKARMRAFSESLNTGNATEPLELSADEINALIAAVPQFRGIAAVELVDGNIRGKVSFPIERMPFGALFKGKYLNGTATIDARIVDGHPVVTVVGLETKGKRVPDAFLVSIRGQNFAQDIDKDTAETIGRLRSIEVKDGKIIYTPKPPAKEEEPAAAEPKEPTKAPEPPKEGKPGAEAKTPEPDQAGGLAEVARVTTRTIAGLTESDRRFDRG